MFHSVMSRNRYQHVHKFFHFANNEELTAGDKLFKVRGVVEYLVQKFKTVYYPTKNISIDEQLLLHKGNIHFRRYILSKRARFGIKFFTLCDETGYCWNSEIYVGKNGESGEKQEPSLGKSGQVVVRLIESLIDHGHHSYVDNFYTSPALFNYLHDKKTVACGTLCQSRGKFPAAFSCDKPARGDAKYMSKGNILALRFNDKKEVYVINHPHQRISS